MMPISTSAQELNAIFNDVASKKPAFAISAAYVTDNNKPVVLTSGPTIKNGSVSVDNNARWHIGSISKSFTSTLVMQLVDQGILDLDTPIEDYLPAHTNSMHQSWKEVSLRALLSHTSGLPANVDSKFFTQEHTQSPRETRRTILSTMWEKESGGKIGQFNYSNLGYVLAGLIIEETTNKSWEELIVSQIAKPLGLSSLGFGAPLQEEDPWGHKSIFGFKSPVDPKDPNSDNPKWMGPAGTIHMTMADLVKWGQAHINACKGLTPEFLSKESCQVMQTPVVPDYGLGWGIEGSQIWHDGSNTFWYALLYIAPDSDIVIAVATNVFAQRRLENLVGNLSDALVD